MAQFKNAGKKLEGMVQAETIGRFDQNWDQRTIIGETVHVYFDKAPRQWAEDKPEPEIGPNPYKGLSAFDEKDADRFFGRDRVVEKLVERFSGFFPEGGQSPLRFLSILGPSGSGKSSVARAGLIPRLDRLSGPGRAGFQVAVFRPGSHPLESLASMLARIVTEEPAPVQKSREFCDEMTIQNASGHWDGLRRIAGAMPGIDARPLVLLVDQFEEIYTFADAETDREAQETHLQETNRFIENLLHAAADPAGHVSVVITLRSDFLPQVQEHPVLSHAIAGCHEIVPAMNDEELRQAVALPARHAGHPLDDSTVDLLIEQSRGREGALPLLEFALESIWNGMAHGKAPADTLREMGGVGGALAYKAGEIYKKLKPEQQPIARRAFRKLVRLGEGARDTRRRMPISEMVGMKETPEQVLAVLRQFASPQARLLTLLDAPVATDSESSRTTPAIEVEITHEALFDHWEVLREWIRDHRDDIRFEDRLRVAVKDWTDRGKPAGSLWWQSPNLDLLTDFHSRQAEDMNRDQVDFFRASTKKARKARILRLTFTGMLIFLTVFSLILGGYAMRARNRAEKSRDLAEKQKELALEAVNTLTYDFADRLNALPRTQPIVEEILTANADLLDRIYQLAPDTARARREKASNLDRLGTLYMELGRTEAAARAYKDSMEILKKLADDDPNNSQAQRDLSVSFSKLGDLYVRMGLTDKAIDAYKKAMQISKKLADDDPNNSQAQRDLSVSFNKLGHLYVRMGLTDKAIDAYKKAMQIRKKLADDDPNNSQAQQDLMISHAKMGFFYREQQDMAAALDHFEKGLAIVEPLAKKDPKNEQLQKQYEGLKALVASLKTGSSQ